MHPLTEKVFKAIKYNLDDNKLNQLIIEEMERIYRFLLAGGLNVSTKVVDIHRDNLKQILNLPEDKSLEEELAEKLKRMSEWDSKLLSKAALNFARENKDKL